MLTLENRVQLRNEIFNILINSSVIITINSKYKIHRKQNLIDALINNSNLKILYDLYVSEFRSEEEAIYCILNQDDYENHKCIVCGSICDFYINLKRYRFHYKMTCGKNECFQKIANSPEAQQKAKDTKDTKYGNPNYNNPEKHKDTCQKLYNDPNYNNHEQAKQTCLDRYNEDNPFKVKEFQEKAKDTKERLYGDPNYNNHKKAQESCEAKYGPGIKNPFQAEPCKQKARETWKNNYGPGITNPMQVEEIRKRQEESCLANLHVRNPMQSHAVQELKQKRYQERYGITDPILIGECQELLDQIEQGLELYEAYINNKFLKEFIILLYNKKNRLLHVNELMDIFTKGRSTIHRKIHQLNLEKYFNLQDSLYELQLSDFLIDNGYIEDKDFERHLFNLTIDKDHRQQLDFLFKDYKIAFEVNDVSGHNSTKKDSNYHINKTLMAKEQHNIRLIHLWEWELNETNWPKTSQWILHILNQDKIQLNIFNDNNYDIRLVNKKDQTTFLDQYSLDNNRDFNKSIGIYHNNELIQTLSFKDNVLSICIKFGYDIIEGTKDIIQYYLQNSSYDHILAYCNLDKFTGKSYEELGFQLLEYKVPSIISELPNESSEYKQLYNCGTNVYVMFKE